MNNIFQTLLYQREKQKDTVLATIVWDDGSAPRGAGSQMLVRSEENRPALAMFTRHLRRQPMGSQA